MNETLKSLNLLVQAWALRKTLDLLDVSPNVSENPRASTASEKSASDRSVMIYVDFSGSMINYDRFEHYPELTDLLVRLCACFNVTAKNMRFRLFSEDVSIVFHYDEIDSEAKINEIAEYEPAMRGGTDLDALAKFLRSDVDTETYGVFAIFTDAVIMNASAELWRAIDYAASRDYHVHIEHIANKFDAVPELPASDNLVTYHRINAFD